jgi:hypothetical protein
MFSEYANLIFVTIIPWFISLWAIILLSDFSGKRNILEGWRRIAMLSIIALLILSGIWVGFFKHPSWHPEAWRSWMIYWMCAAALSIYGGSVRGKSVSKQADK